MEHLSNDHEDHPNQHKNRDKQCNEMGYPVVNMIESQWKLRQKHDQNFPEFSRDKSQRKSFLHINCETMHMSTRILSD